MVRWANLFALPVIVTVLAAGAGAWIGRERSDFKGALHLDLDTEAFRRGVLQGKVVEVPFTLHNSGSEPADIVAVHKSCGCLSVRDATGQALAVPRRIVAGELLNGTVSLSTGTRQGLSIEPLRVEYMQGGSTFSCESQLKLHVCAAPHSINGPVVLSSGQLRGTAIVGDAFPERVAFKTVDFDPRRIASAELELLPGSKQPAMPGREVAETRCTVVPRYRVHITGKMSVRDYRTYVTLIPEDEGYDECRVPVHFRSADRNAGWRVVPQVIMVDPAARKPYRRRIHVLPPQSRAADLRGLRVVSSSSLLQAAGEHVGNVFIINLTIDHPDQITRAENLRVRSHRGELIGTISVRPVGVE